MAFRRVPEAISAVVPVLGVIALAILLAISYGDNHSIYHWTDAEHVKHDSILNFKKGFLNKGFYTFMTVFTVVAWSLLGWKMRKLSRSLDNNPITSVEGRKIYLEQYSMGSSLYRCLLINCNVVHTVALVNEH